jgi:hypothetical protein
VPSTPAFRNGPQQNGQGIRQIRDVDGNALILLINYLNSMMGIDVPF